MHPSGFGKESFDGEPKWQLYDMAADPFEQHDLAAQHPEIVQNMQAQYDNWFADVSATRPDNYAPPRIIVGSPEESLTVLTRQDWRGANWGPKDQGFWLIDAAHPGAYEIRLRFRSPPADGTATLQVGDRKLSSNVKAGADEAMFPSVELSEGPQRITAWIETGGETAGVMFVELRRK